MVVCTLSITQCLRLNLQLHTIDLVRTCRISSFFTVAWKLARFQLTRRIARSLGDSCASCLPRDRDICKGRASVRNSSVCLINRQQQRQPAGLLLSVLWAGYRCGRCACNSKCGQHHVESRSTKEAQQCLVCRATLCSSRPLYSSVCTSAKTYITQTHKQPFRAVRRL